MMKFTGKSEEIAQKLVALFKSGSPGEAVANLFLQGSGKHCDGYSWNNRLLVALSGYTDAMGFKQWKAKGRTVKKGEKALYILAPLACKGKRKDSQGVEKEYQFIRGFRGVPVFGYEQTEGDELTFESQDNEHLSTLPLLNVAKEWGIKVGSYNGQGKSAAGWFEPTSLSIMLGVKNISTWLHELVHAAEFRFGTLNNAEYKADKASAEIVAEFGATILAHALGLEEHADEGGCWSYVQHYIGGSDMSVEEACYKLINRTCQAVNHILEENDRLDCPECGGDSFTHDMDGNEIKCGTCEDVSAELVTT